MNKLPRLKGKQVVSAPKKTGFTVVRTRGSHNFLQHGDGRCTVVPMHAGENIGPGLLAKILRDCELTQDKFASLL